MTCHCMQLGEHSRATNVLVRASLALADSLTRCPWRICTHWGRKRHFGLVCGRCAALCSYENPGAPGAVDERALTDSGVKNDPDYKAMLPLLRHLSTSSQLGPVKLLNALTCHWPGLEVPRNDKVHVFLGDIHAPVLTDRERTYMQDGVPAVASSGPPIPRRGRLDVGPMNVGLGAAAAALAALVVSPVKYPSAAALTAALSGIFAYLLQHERVVSWSDTETMPRDEAAEWFRLYHGSIGAKGADIFETAGADLTAWLGLLLGYQASREQLGGNPVRLVQLGDLYDLWIGLRRAFDSISPRSFFDEASARQFTEFWRSETTEEHHGGNYEPHHSSQASHIRRLLHIDDGVPTHHQLGATFLYGNHDNYMGAGRISPKRSDAFIETGLWAEHGHQSDPFNRDTDAHLGWAITQVAYVQPDIRSAQELAANLFAKVTGSVGERLTQMAYAADRCFNLSTPIIDLCDGTYPPTLPTRDSHLRNSKLPVTR